MDKAIPALESGLHVLGSEKVGSCMLENADIALCFHQNPCFKDCFLYLW
jgi:hypothetical protein